MELLRYRSDVRNYHGIIRDFLLGRIALLTSAEDFVNFGGYHLLKVGYSFRGIFACACTRGSVLCAVNCTECVIRGVISVLSIANRVAVYTFLDHDLDFVYYFISQGEYFEYSLFMLNFIDGFSPIR